MNSLTVANNVITTKSQQKCPKTDIKIDTKKISEITILYWYMLNDKHVPIYYGVRSLSLMEQVKDVQGKSLLSIMSFQK